MEKYSPEFFDPNNKKIKLTFDEIKKAIDEKQILEFRVADCDADRNLKMNFDNNLTGVIPLSELQYNIFNKHTHEKNALFKVGKYIKFIPLYYDYTDDGKNIIVMCSRKLAQEECYNNYISKIVPGDIIDAKIINFETYGVFCDIGCGIPSLLPYGHISIVNTPNPNVELRTMDKLRVVVRTTIDKIVLSHRELLGTWEQEVAKFHEKDIVEGIVVNKQPYGVFIKISQNLSGLADSSNEIDNLEEGDYVEVQITSIHSKGMKVKLSIIRKLDNIDIKPFEYYYKVGEHIDKWQYNNADYHKTIGTDFSKTNSDMIEFNRRNNG